MEAKERRLENASTELTVKVPVEAIHKEYDKEFNKISKNAKIDGFRQGKAPLDLVKKKYYDTAKQNVLEQIVKDFYLKAIDELELRPVDHPKFDFEAFNDNEPFEFKAIVDLYPTVELGEYKGIEVEEDQVTVADEDVTAEIDAVREKQVELELRGDDEAAQKGDQVSIKIKKLDGTNKDSEEGFFDMDVVAGKSGSNLEFDDYVEGLKKGDSKEIELKYPDDYRIEGLRGEASSYIIKVGDINKRNFPELTDEFVKSLGEFETVAELTDNTRETLEKYTSERSRSEAKSMVLNKVIEKSNYEIPKSLMEQEKKGIIARLGQRMNMQIDDPKMLAAMMGMKEDSLNEKLDEQALQSIKTTLTLAELNEKEKFEVTEEIYDEKLKVIAEQYQQSFEDLKAAFEKSGDKEKMKSDMIFDLAMDFLYDNAKVKKGKAYSARDYLTRENTNQ